MKYINERPLALFGFLYTIRIAIFIYIPQQYWSESHQHSIYEYRRWLCETVIYGKLIAGPSFDVLNRIPRKFLQDRVRSQMTPSPTGRLYPLVIGEHGVGKTTLI